MYFPTIGCYVYVICLFCALCLFLLLSVFRDFCVARSKRMLISLLSCYLLYAFVSMNVCGFVWNHGGVPCWVFNGPYQELNVSTFTFLRTVAHPTRILRGHMPLPGLSYSTPCPNVMNRHTSSLHKLASTALTLVQQNQFVSLFFRRQVQQLRLTMSGNFKQLAYSRR